MLAFLLWGLVNVGTEVKLFFNVGKGEAGGLWAVFDGDTLV